MNIKKINWKRLFLNKYFIVTIIFAVFMIFFDKYNLLKLHKMNNELDEMQERVDDYNEEYEKDSITLHLLKTDPEFREEYAREHYFMKQPKEEVYFIQSDEEE